MRAPSRPISLALTLAACVAAWVATCGALEWVARRAESRLDAHLWRGEEWMQLLSPARYTAGATRRILIIGPSEAREAFWPEPFREVLDGVTLVNDSLSQSTLEDAVTQLEYIERVYGRGAMGDLVVLAVAPRFIQGYVPGERPFPIVLNRYSPQFALDEGVEPQRLVEKGVLASALARVRLAGHSGARYQRALRAVFLAVRARLLHEDLDAAFREHGLVGSRFFADRSFDKAPYYEWARTGTGILPSLRAYFRLRGMDPNDQRTAVMRDFTRLREIAARNGARVLVVNMPEGGWARDVFYDPGVPEAYAAVVREAAGGLPFIDMREALSDDGFFDWMHPTRAAGLELSRRVAREIRRMDLL